MSVFSDRLRELRKDKKISQAALAKEVGVSPRVYQDYEYGKREAQMTTLVRMADFFGVSLDYLTGRTDTP